MDCYATTLRYYARWLGADETALRAPTVRAVFCANRNIAFAGFSKPDDLVVWMAGATTIISYGDRTAAEAEILVRVAASRVTLERLATEIALRCGQTPAHSVKYSLRSPSKVVSSARVLTAEDYTSFEAFFKSCHLKCADLSWLKGYYDDLVARKLAWGVFVDGALVSASDAPDMPFLSSEVQEIGINTRAEFRGHGYAKMACAAAIESLLGRGICPLWSTGVENVASQRLAHSLGFERIADVLTLSL